MTISNSSQSTWWTPAALTLISCVWIGTVLSVSSFTSAQAAALPMAAPAQTPPVLGINDRNNPLHLTPDQQHKWLIVKLKFQQKGSAIFANTKLTAAERKAALDSVHAQSIVELKALLTPTQLAAADKQEAFVKLTMQRSQQYNALKLQLANSMTPDQRHQMEAIEANAKAQEATINGDKTTSPAQKSALLEQLVKQYQGQMSVLFSLPVQQSTIKQMKALQAQEDADRMKLRQQ